MKKFLLISLFSAAAVVNADETALAEAKPEALAEAKPEAKAEAKPEAKAEAKAEAKPEAKAEGKIETPAVATPGYWVRTQDFAHAWVGQYVEAHPYYAMAATAVVTIAAVKAIDYAVASADEEDEF